MVTETASGLAWRMTLSRSSSSLRFNAFSSLLGLVIRSIGRSQDWPAVVASCIERSPMLSVMSSAFCCSPDGGSGAPEPNCWTWRREICVQTAV